MNWIECSAQKFHAEFDGGLSRESLFVAPLKANQETVVVAVELLAPSKIIERLHFSALVARRKNPTE